ncbi:MAG TPA: TonB-dependent receptor [Dongiaceae bacterium]|nr:TonB-dependent receptor [Dongiaceae bacterium]
MSSAIVAASLIMLGSAPVAWAAEEPAEEPAAATTAANAEEVPVEAEDSLPEDAAAPAAENDSAVAEVSNVQQLGRVVVTSRNKEEKAQSVPLPVSVLGSKQLERDGTITVDDLTRKAPGLTATTPNARRTGISIRGIGKASGNDSMEAAVGLIVDGVPLTHVGMSYQDFTDLDRVEILRGPQGTLLGKNTTMGALNYVSKAPSFSPQSNLEVETGQHDALKLKASGSNALVEDVLAYRASFHLDTQDGDLKNINEEGETYHERNRYAARVQLQLNATDNFTARLNLDTAEVKENSNTKPWMEDPETFANGVSRTASNGRTFTSRLARDYFKGYQPVIGDRAWDEIDIGQAKPLITENNGQALTLDWDVGSVSLTSITAHRDFLFDAKNDSDQTKFDINRGGNLVNHKQVSQEFRVTSNDVRKVDYQAGVYLLHSETDSNSRTLYGEDAGAFYATNAQYTTLNTAADLHFLQDSLDNVYQSTRIKPETDSAAVFGQIDWHITEKGTLTLGLRNTEEEKSSSTNKTATFYDGSPLASTGNATADAIRTAQLGSVYGFVDGEDIDDSSISWLASPSYQLTDDVMLYASVAEGEKSGSVQFSTTGVPQNVDPEQSFDIELGFKSLLLNQNLMLNVNFYQTVVKDYQATTSIVDSTSSTGYSSVLGNIPEIRARGVEIEGAYAITAALSVNFAAAYNRAIYTDWATATCPAEIPTSVAPVCDNTGKQIVGAPKWTGILGVDYHAPLPVAGLGLHAYLNSVVRSEQNLEAQLSQYGFQPGYGLLDGGIGLTGKFDGEYEVTLIGKNILDKQYTTSINNFTNSAPVGYDGIGARRYVGLALKASF